MKKPHDDCMVHIESMRKILKNDVLKAEEKEGIIKMLKLYNTSRDYMEQFKSVEKCVKVSVLMDATGSMSNLLNNAKETIKLYFEEVCKGLVQNQFKTSLFKI